MGHVWVLKFKQPVHHYRLLGLSLTCASEAVHLMTCLCEAVLPVGYVWCWAARYNTWLLIELTPKGVVFSFLFLCCGVEHDQITMIKQITAEK